MFCPICGNENKEGSKFCAVCGAQLDMTQQEPAGDQRQEPTDEERPEPAGQETGESAPEPEEEQKKGFFHRAAGIAVIIVIIAAAAVAAVFIALHVRAVRLSEQEGEELTEETAEIFPDEEDTFSDEAEEPEEITAFAAYDVGELSEEREAMYAPMETCVYILSGGDFTYDWNDPVFVWDALINLINDYEDLFYSEDSDLSGGYLWVSEDAVKECASALFSDFDGELPEIPSSFTANPVKEDGRYGIKVGDRGIDGDGRYITSWQEYSDGSAVVEMSSCAPDDPETVYSTYSINLVKNEYTADLTDPLFTYSIAAVETTYKRPVDEDETSAVAVYYILPDSDTRYYTEGELSTYTLNQLRLARNEIYARHGRIFESEDLKSYFEDQPWYTGTIAPEDFSESMLNEYEKANIALIQSMEENFSAASGSSAGVTFFAAGETCSCDLDGDGIEETVCAYMDKDNWHGCLLINGTLSATIDWALDIGEFCIVDINTSDNTLQIGVTSYEEDSEVATYFYGYSSGSVQELGRIPGAFYGDEPYPNIVCPGDGTVESYRALYLFETWFAGTAWTLRNGELMEMVPSVYEPLDLFDGRGIDLTVLQDIWVTRDGPYSGESFVLPAGSKIHMNGTDNTNWVSFTADGYDGTLYLWLDSGYYVPLAGGGYDLVSSVFENLSMFG